MSRAILVTGASGQLGTELQRCAWPEGWRVVAVGRDRLDLSETDRITEIIASGYEGEPWAAVINGAAYTAVDRAESDQIAAWKVNALAPAAFGEACAKAGIPLVQISTDYVFAGDKHGPWEIDDPVAPLSVYGASKLGGELAVRAESNTLKVVDDQHGSPTFAKDLAHASMTIAIRLAEDQAAPTGTFHFSNAGETTWARFAAEIFRQSGLRGGPVTTVQPITTADYPTPARRPAHSLLSHVAIASAYGIAPRPWQQALSETLDELIGNAK
jgi:dTDP-4-dehydrorhamnose reductase